MEILAFISYSRKDKIIANWLHSKLEKYHILTINQKKPNYWMLEIL